MIEVAVRQQDPFRRDLELIDRLADVRDVAARIYDGRAIGGGAGDDRAVLLDRRDRHDGDFERLHGKSFRSEDASASYRQAVLPREVLQRGLRPCAEMLDYLCRSKRTELGGGAMVLTASDSDEKSRCEQIAGASGINELVDWRGFHDFVALARHDHTTLFAARHHGEPHVIAQRRGRGVEV